ncbi:MAG: hypothetical protein HQK91_02970 [Nitrospirae bacterium]|nr:hypothetical protein [Nitrospirota bacterium]
MDKKYNIIFTGNLLEGFDKDQVWENLSNVYGQRSDDLKLEAFFTGRMIVLSRNLVYEDADNVLDIFEAAGLDCVAVPEEIEEPADKVLLNGDYNLVYTGIIKEGFSKDQVKENLSNFYGKRGSDQLIETFIAGKQIILMKKVNLKVAKMNLVLYEESGLQCMIEPTQEEKNAVSPEMEDIEDIIEEQAEDSLRVFADTGKAKPQALPEKRAPIPILKETPMKSGFFRANKKITEEHFCQNCKGKFIVDQEITKCPKCGVYYDRPCWEKNGGCLQPECASHLRQKAIGQTAPKKSYKIDADLDVKDIRSAIIAGLLSGMLTLSAVILSRLSHYDFTRLGYGLYTLLDIFIIYLLIFGIYMRSRVCAIILFIYFVFSRTFIVIETRQIPGWFIVFLFGYFYYRGIRGTFNYHRAYNNRKKENSNN